MFSRLLRVHWHQNRRKRMNLRWAVSLKSSENRKTSNKFSQQKTFTSRKISHSIIKLAFRGIFLKKESSNFIRSSSSYNIFKIRRFSSNFPILSPGTKNRKIFAVVEIINSVRNRLLTIKIDVLACFHGWSHFFPTLEHRAVI